MRAETGVAWPGNGLRESPGPERADPATEAELRARLEAMAPERALGVLQDLASALFPSGSGALEQVSWEPTAEPPEPATAVPAAPPAPDLQSAAEARLRAAELRYRTLLEQIPAVTFMAVLGEGDNEIYVSPYIEALLGYTQEEWLENPFLWYDRLHPADRALWIEEFARGCRTGGPFRAECRFIARDGRVVWVRGEARLIKDELGRPLFLQGVAFDITESKRAHEQVLHHVVRRTEERYRDLVELLGAIFWEADADTGAFSFVSRGVERILGYPPQRWLESPGFWIDCIHPEDRQRVAAAWREALTRRGDGEIEFRAVSADGRIVWLHNSIHFPDAGGADSRPLGVLLDMTERKHWEEALARALESERRARADAEEARRIAEAANRVKDEFLATMSHELRTPVNAVLGWADILETGAGGRAMGERALAAIRSNARAQAQLLDDLFDISRIVAGKLRLHITPIRLAYVVNEALDTVRLAADAKRIDLRAQFLAADATVRGDVDRLRQVVSNLLSNAVKFTPEDGKIDLRLESDGARARIVVADTGEGIEPSFLPYVFERFRQADNTATRTHGGLGLGLAIVRQLVELHGGSVRAESPGRGQGATFIVELPLAQGESTEPAAEPATEPAAEPGAEPGAEPAAGEVKDP